MFNMNADCYFRRDDISRAGVSSQECSCNLNLENMNDCRANLLAWPHLHDTADFRTSNEPSIPLQVASYSLNDCLTLILNDYFIE